MDTKFKLLVIMNGALMVLCSLFLLQGFIKNSAARQQTPVASAATIKASFDQVAGPAT